MECADGCIRFADRHHGNRKISACAASAKTTSLAWDGSDITSIATLPPNVYISDAPGTTSFRGHDITMKNILSDMPLLLVVNQEGLYYHDESLKTRQQIYFCHAVPSSALE